MLKILFLSLGMFSLLNLLPLVQANPARADGLNPSANQPMTSTQGAENGEFAPLLAQVAQTTQGPEESEFSYDHYAEDQSFGLQVAVGQTLLSGEEASPRKGFNNAIGAGGGVSFRYTEQLHFLAEYWTSTHQGIETSGVLKKNHVATTIHYALQQGFFSPVGIIGAGVYFSSFEPGAVQKAEGLVASNADTFGVVFGLGGKLDLANNFAVNLNAIRHHSFKFQNAKNQSEELLPFTIIGLMATFYF